MIKYIWNNNYTHINIEIIMNADNSLIKISLK